MWRKRCWRWWDVYGGFVVGAVLIVVGLSISRLMDLGDIFDTHTRRGLSDALMIAGILAFAVDPLVKSKAHRAATRDIFHHILGFNLPPKIKDRLLDIVKGTTLYRENTTIHCVLSEIGEFLQFDIEMEYEIVNPTQRTEQFSPALQFEKGEHAVLKKIICFNDPGYGKDAKLTPNAKEPNSFEYLGEAINIPSEDRRRFKYWYSVQHPTTVGFFYQIFQYPTIGLSLTVEPHPLITIKANPAQFESAGEWRYDNLFMPQDHLDIRWNKS